MRLLLLSALLNLSWAHAAPGTVYFNCAITTVMNAENKNHKWEVRSDTREFSQIPAGQRHVGGILNFVNLGSEAATFVGSVQNYELKRIATDGEGQIYLSAPGDGSKTLYSFFPGKKSDEPSFLVVNRNQTDQLSLKAYSCRSHL